MRNRFSRASLGFAALPLALLLSACGAQTPESADEAAAPLVRGTRSEAAASYDVSPPLFLMRPAGPPAIENDEHEVKPVPRPRASQFPAAPVHDHALQSTFSPLLAMPATTHSFDGVGNGFTGPAGTFTVNSAPPDTNGDVGPNHYVQTVNSEFAVWNKSGTVVYGPVALNTLWSGFGGGCQTNNDGDPVVIYDSIADRWVISQFSVSTTPYLQCVAVSTTPDPTGSYYRYSFSYGTSDFPDYPKMGVWPDAYYTTFNIFANGSTFSGARICAYDRTKMLAGQAATQQCFNTSSSIGGLLPADLDGARLPPAGAPNYALALGASANQLAFYKFHVDWTTPASSTFTGPTNLATVAFSEACSGGTCIPQKGTTQKLDSLADRLMFRLAYRNFGDHEALVASHSVTAGSSTGVRWYELRLASGTPSIFQQGTYAPDANYRWMPSIAMDQQGNMALGFSISSSTTNPQIYYTGRLVGDAAGTMPQGEGSIINTAAGSQTGSSLSRWGDYSNMAVDPSDDCTFWYTTEYIPSNGAFNWKTRIGSFKFPGCGGAASNDFSIGATPASASVVQGSGTSLTVSTAVTSGSAESVAFSVSGLPSGATGTFSPASATAGGSSTLSVATTSSAAVGTYTLTITGAAASATHTATVSLTITAPVSNDFTLAVSPSSGSVQAGSATTTSVSVVVSGSPGTITLSASGLPAGVTASFSPATLSASGSSTLTLTAASSAAAGASAVTVTGTAGSKTHSAGYALTVTVVPPADFAISLSPASGSVAAGASTTTTATLAWTGTAASTALSVSGLPTGVTGSFSPATVAGNGSSVLTLTAASSAAAGSATVTVTGTSGSLSHSATFALTVTSGGGGSVLQNGVPITGISGATGSNTYFTMVVPAGQASLVFSTSGGTGDADLYVKFGAQPTTSTYDCRPYTTGNTESCSFTNPAAGTWYVMIRGYAAYSGLSLTGTYTAPVPDNTPALSNGVPVTGISGASGSAQYWKLAVPSGQARVVFTITGSSGDADLYVRSGAKPTTSTYTCRPYLTGSNETCTITSPAAGDWYVMIRGYTAYSGVTLTGTYP